MTEFYPSIDQFRNVIRAVSQKARFGGLDEKGEPFYVDRSLPTINFIGSVKIHGTNAGVVYERAKSGLTCLSRSRMLSFTNDNAGFYVFVNQNNEALERVIIEIHRRYTGTVETIQLFGEWAGRGIQKGVAVSEVDRFFVVFSIKINGEWQDFRGWQIAQPEQRIFSIYDFPTFPVTIDFNHPELSQNKMVEITEAVEKECPVGKAFGVSGIGEGVVYKSFDPEWNSSKFVFKVKGEKHSASKVKTLAEVDVAVVQAVKDFVDYAVTEARLEQGLNWIINEDQKPFEMQSMGDFIRWVFNDVVKEESDVIAANGLDAKKLGSAVANVARPWFIKRFNEGQ